MAFTQVIKTLGSIKSAIDSWLSQNITNPSNPPLDRSLSLANACAPADMVGVINNTVNAHSVNWEHETDPRLNQISFRIGTLLNGYNREITYADFNKYIISDDYILVGKWTKIACTAYNYGVYKYDLQKSYLGNFGGWHNYNNPVTIDEDCYIRISMRKGSPATEILESEIETLVSALQVTYYAPTSETYKNIKNKIPSYYNSQLDSAITSIRNNMNACGQNGDTFVFITDLHWDPTVKYNNRNARRSPALVKKIVEETGLKKIVFGGDYFTGSATPEFEMEQINDLFNAFNIKNTRAYPIMGNHDLNGYSPSTQPWDENTAYALIFKRCENYVVMGEDLYYYYDIDACKTRYIFLNSHDSNSTIPSAQVSWFNNVLSNTPFGYKIIVGMHVWLKIDGSQEQSNQANQIIPIMDNFNVNNPNKKIVFAFGGHVHYDYNFTTPGGIPIVLTDTDAYRSVPSGVTANINTKNEQCFDVITLNYTTNKANLVRIGRGTDREFNLYSGA